MDPLARVGLTALADMYGERDDRLYIPVVHELEHVGVREIPGFHRLAGNTIDAGYGIDRLDLSSFEPLFDQTIALDEATSRQFACGAIGLISLMHPYLIGSINVVAPGVPIANIMCVGYELTTVAEFRDRCGWALAGAEGVGLPGWLVERAGTVDDVVETLSTIPISIHPPRRPRVIWPAQGGAALVNWASMTRLFLDVIERIGAGGAQANQWGEMFEDQIQTWIDQSAWRPAPDLAAMQRRTLRRAGRKLTDVDAVSARDGTLLIVSCKSRALTDAFERGEYGEVRNTRTQAEQALADLERVVADLRTNPIGDNSTSRAIGKSPGSSSFPSCLTSVRLGCKQKRSRGFLSSCLRLSCSNSLARPTERRAGRFGERTPFPPTSSAPGAMPAEPTNSGTSFERLFQECCEPLDRVSVLRWHGHELLST